MKSKIHRCNCRKVWSIQNRKTKVTANTVLLNGAWTTELKPERKCNPKGFVTTQNSWEIIFNPASELVEKFVKVTKLMYDKENVHFNINYGEYLFFADDGSCYVLRKRDEV
ncbi:hypothetical protein BIV60_02020 [Bacillus sp. MUM 116]|uniref:hypothetical protein n=1 Tax=Bacillus sp. MUM 116 TaxID=1678002 RepID=UPI0008F5CD15|nr:hypothetical protein [Bacillus sp. MUM 116]OIK16816.1 hypothetical protein BIV60_02020 [Bacillus sp. MUM 116]